MTMTNDELNERIALALGLKLITMLPGQPKAVAPRGPNGEPLPWRMAPDWATSVDACLRDLLPVMRAKVPGELGLLQYGEACWNAGYYSAWHHGQADRSVFREAEADTPARALCLLFLAVMEATP